MAKQEISLQQMEQILALLAQYIDALKSKYLAVPLHYRQFRKQPWSDFFTDELLESVRITILRRERLANPDFHPMLLSRGFDDFPDISRMSTVTFSNCVVSHGPFTNSLLFHELVHVEQYRQLGIKRFLELYLRGFITGGGYFQIPLEQSAYALGSNYEANPNQHSQFPIMWLDGFLRNVSSKRGFILDCFKL